MLLMHYQGIHVLYFPCVSSNSDQFCFTRVKVQQLTEGLEVAKQQVLCIT